MRHVSPKFYLCTSCTGTSSIKLQAYYRIIKLDVYKRQLVGIVTIALSGVFPLLYNTTDHIRSLAQKFIIIYGCFQPVYAISNVEYFSLRSGGKMLITFRCV